MWVLTVVPSPPELLSIVVQVGVQQQSGSVVKEPPTVRRAPSSITNGVINLFLLNI